MGASLIYRVSRGFCRGTILPLLRFRVGGLEHVPASGGVVLASNHQSFLDPVVLGCGCPRVPVHFMARDSLFHMGPMGWYLRATHTFPVRRGGADRAAWKRFEDLVSAGEAVSFFPEGTRSPDGKLLPVNPGSGMLLHRCPGAKVVPTRIRGTHRVLPRAGGFGGFRPVSLAFGPPVDLAEEWARGGDREVYAAIAAKVMAAIAAIPPVDGLDEDGSGA